MARRIAPKIRRSSNLPGPARAARLILAKPDLCGSEYFQAYPSTDRDLGSIAMDHRALLRHSFTRCGYKNQATTLARRIEELRTGAPAPVQGAIDLMELTSRTANLFLAQPPQEKQAFLRLVLKSAAWQHGELQTQFEEPFENLRCSNQLSRRKDTDIVVGDTPNGIWFREQDSNFSPLVNSHSLF